MEKAKKFVEGQLFQNSILIIIVLNSAIMGILTAQNLPVGIRQALTMLDTVCLWIFIVELLIKLVVYRLHFFRNGWNLFDLAVVLLSLFSEFSFFSVFRIFRIFRVLRSLKALKSLRTFRLVSGLKNLRIIVEAIGRSVPGIVWSGMLLLLVYYIFAIMGTTLFGPQFPEWFGSMGRSFYTLFQVMTLESWSMGIVVNAISEVSENQAVEEKGISEEDVQAQLRRELAILKNQLVHMEELLDRQEMEKR